MDRTARALQRIDATGLGLEIGPSYNPIAPKRAGFNVRTLDHTTKDGLLSKYSAIGVSQPELDRIEDVDFVWEGQPLRKAIATGEVFDYILASHVIEHTVDLIGFLNECSEILADNGVVSLIVPDKRFCFDHFRPLTSAGQAVEAHLFPRPVHGPASFVDTHLYTVRRHTHGNTWTQDSIDGLALADCAWDRVNETVSYVEPQDTYIDIHRWVFTPTSFQLLLADLSDLGYLDLAVDSVTPTQDFEFFVTLRHRSSSDTGTASVAASDRWQMLLAIEAELTSANLGVDADVAPQHWKHPVRSTRLLGRRARRVAGRLRRQRLERQGDARLLGS